MIRRWLPCLAAVLLAACSTVDSRIRAQQSLFDSYPPQVQREIRAGQIALGFTPDQVHMALGKPDRVVQRSDATGSSEIWVYHHGGNLGLSLGIGGFSGGSTAIGGGVGVSSSNYGGNELRVVFRDGRVTAIERSTG